MRVVVESHWRGERWEGEIPPPADAERALEYVFRYFNRVDEGDGERLEALGYRLPSLGVGDLVTIDDGPRYRCASLGWERADEPTRDPLVELERNLRKQS